MGRGTRCVGVLLVAALVAASARADTPPPGARSLPATISTRFDPARDGLPFGNSGDFASPGGNCWGMSLVAIDRYVQRTTNPPARARAPRQPAPPVATSPGQADPRVQATAGLTQHTAIGRDLEATGGRAPLSDPSRIRAALERIDASGVPEVLIMEGPQGAHAVVLYGYRSGALQVYDPNFPGEAIAWPWDPVAGLGKNPKANPGDFYDTLTLATATPFDAHRTAADMARLREACTAQDPECVDRYPDFRARLVRNDDGTTVVSGQAVARDGKLPARVWVAVNGTPVAQVPVSRFGTFGVEVPRAALTAETNRVRIVGEVDTPLGVPQFAGFADLDVQRPPAFIPRRRPGGTPPSPQAGPVSGPWAGRPAPAPAPAPSATRGLAGALPGGGR